MELLPAWAPNAHPLLVHFPIAILILAMIMNVLSFFMSDEWWDELKTSLLYLFGTIAAGITYYSGTLAADSVTFTDAAKPVISAHADWAFWTLWFFIGYTVLRLVLHGMQLMEQQQARVFTFLIVLPGLFFLIETGEHGGELVYEHAIGVETQVIEPDSTMESTGTDSLESQKASKPESENTEEH
jgi:uncharacterized membrane protein